MQLFIQDIPPPLLAEDESELQVGELVKFGKMDADFVDSLPTGVNIKVRRSISSSRLVSLLVFYTGRRWRNSQEVERGGAEDGS